MVDRQIRWMFGLTLLVLAVAVVLYLDETKEEDAESEGSVVLLELSDAADVTGLRLTRGDDEVVLERGEHGWEVVKPFAALADAERVERLVDDLMAVSRGTPLEVEDAPLEGFGLGQPPRLVATLTLGKGEEQRLVLGDEAPVGWSSYAQAPDGQVVVVPGQPGRIAMESADAFRDHRLIRLDPGQVRAVELISPEGELRVSGEGVEWWLEGFARADADRVDDLVLGLMDLRFDRILPIDDDIEQPVRIARLILEDATVYEIRVGNGTPMGTLVQAGDAMGVVFPESLAILGMGPKDIGLRSAFPLRMDRADRLSVSGEGGTWEAHRSQSEWAAEGMDSATVWGLVKRLSEVPHSYRSQTPPEPSEIYRTIEIVEGERHLFVDVGEVIEPGFRTVKDRAGGQAYRIPDTALEFLSL